ncbi:uncharacterized protein LOC131614218 [Vicia villosa]|uniref:uncharacterized protein LOC131614218 n=1 Tax=Vicia villosa TaxID=3911 RepID=UPI00273C44ED|nr:uncharacterized protein LOC131614218 [Vicia villosa]
MIIGTLNIRGGGNALKRRRINSLILKSKADVFLIQETKIRELQDFVAKSFWSGGDIGYSFSNSSGRSGGILTLWKEQALEVIFSFKGEGYLGIKFCMDNNFFYLLNVYSSCDASKKRVLWRKILDLKEDWDDGEWIIGGDFNAIKDRRERKGRWVDSNSQDFRGFADFIEETRLVDVPCKGRKFTWYSGDGRSMSRIDRFLVLEKVVNDWGVVGQLVGEINVSDHCPIWLEEWKSFRVHGRGYYVLKQKIFLLKSSLKRWNKEVFGRLDLEIQGGVGTINNGDALLEAEEEWMKEGDSNSGFFHKVMKEKRRFNHIGPFSTPEGMVESVNDIRDFVAHHFAKKFKEE